MNFPPLYRIRQSRDMLGAFKGINKNPAPAENEFADMQNCVSNDYPVFSSGCSWGTTTVGAAGRYILLYADTVNNKLCKIASETNTDTGVTTFTFIYDGVSKGTFTNVYPKSVVMIGSKICIFPSGHYYDTVSTTWGTLSITVNNTNGASFHNVTYDLCDASGNVLTFISEIIPPYYAGADGEYWLNNTTSPKTLYRYSGLKLQWEPVTNTYIKIACASNIFASLSVGERVTIASSTYPGMNSNKVITAAAAGYIVVEADIYESSTKTQTTLVAFNRGVPTMEFVVEHKNRLWGCSADGREIYACALGNPFVWYLYTTDATSAYSATVGSGGMFTGAVSFRGYVWFFKEDRLYKVFESNYPAVSIIEQPADGIENGSDKSIAVIDGILYYKSATVIIAFTGDEFFRISDNFGGDFRFYKNAHAGKLNHKYYISVEDTSRSWLSGEGYYLLVYDTRLRVWHNESIGKDLFGLSFRNFARVSDRLYFIKQHAPSGGQAEDTIVQYFVQGVTTITAAHKAYTFDEGSVWFAETGDWGMNMPDKKYISMLQIRLSTDDSIVLKIKYDGGEWITAATIPAKGKQSVTVPLRIRRCDYFRLRFSGNGNTKIYSITKTIEQGGAR